MITSAISKHTTQLPTEPLAWCRDGTYLENSWEQTAVWEAQRHLPHLSYAGSTHFSSEKYPSHKKRTRNQYHHFPTPRSDRPSQWPQETTHIRGTMARCYQRAFRAGTYSTQITPNWPQCCAGWGFQALWATVHGRKKVRLSVAWVALLSLPCPCISSALHSPSLPTFLF